MIRLDDNRALTAALRNGEQVVPVFIFDPAILTRESTGAARVRFLFESLTELDKALRQRGSQLIIRQGDPTEQLTQLVRETEASALHYSRDYGTYSRKRDASVDRAMQTLGVRVETACDLLVSEPGEILSKMNTPYTVFTPYKRVWLDQPTEEPVSVPSRIPTPEDIRSEALPELPSDVSGEPHQQAVVHGGETEAHERLGRFLDTSIGGYSTQRDLPGEEGTSRLSAALKMGVISPRRILAEIRNRRLRLGSEQRQGADTFLSEIAWRDFYYQILFHFPHVSEGKSFKPAFDAIEWDNKSEFFAAWCEGLTGYPVVDAAQRQLNAQAWMHNRARMISASFLTKDLLCDWRMGERYFMQNLVDGDFASNNGGWQWAAGTGTDAQPYFRIFNPVLQGEKFDSGGNYVRRWIPELTKMPTKFIHRPWDLPKAEQEAIGCVIGRDYPSPIVDHKVQRERALAMYKLGLPQARKTDDGEANDES